MVSFRAFQQKKTREERGSLLGECPTRSDDTDDVAAASSSRRSRRSKRDDNDESKDSFVPFQGSIITCEKAPSSELFEDLEEGVQAPRSGDDATPNVTLEYASDEMDEEDDDDQQQRSDDDTVKRTNSTRNIAREDRDNGSFWPIWAAGIGLLSSEIMHVFHCLAQCLCAGVSFFDEDDAVSVATAIAGGTGTINPK